MNVSAPNNIDASTQSLVDEYKNLKSQYKKIKQELEADTSNVKDEQKIKLKKKIKKRLKEIKKLVSVEDK